VRGCVVAKRRRDRWNRVIRQNAMSRNLEFIVKSMDGKESERPFKRTDVGCRATAAGEKAANKSCPRKRITRESRTSKREIW